MSSIMPVTLTSTFADLPDTAVNLVHMGNGRWYDPTIGRPLQPNPAAGAPTAPQTMSRYAATPAGQPGVYEAVASSFNPFTNDITSNTGKAFIGNFVGNGLERYATASLRTTTEMVWRTIYKRVPRSGLVDEALTVSYTIGSFVKRGFGRNLFNRAYALNSRIVSEQVQVAVQTTAHHLPAGRLAEKIITNKISLAGLDLGIGLGIDIGYQILLDFGNPYLTGSQITKRAVLGQGVGSFVSFAGGLGAKRLATAYIGASVGGPIGFVVGIGISIAWDIWVAPQIYKALDAEPTRNLYPFKGLN